MRWMRMVGIPMLAVLTAMMLATSSIATEPESDPAMVLHVDTWQLLQSSGAELYAELCGSCHGPTGAGRVIMVGGRQLTAPDLTHLEAAGVPEQHWTYVVDSPCDDSHHEIMPCWRTVFREALGNETLPRLVTARLHDHLVTIQE